MNEIELLNQVIPLLPQNADTIVGPGDDCAVIRVGGAWQLLAVDQVVSGIHYLPGTAPGRVAVKLLKRNLSDVAAMGGMPHSALLTLAGNIRDDAWMLEFFRAIAAAAKRYGVAISGGDLASLPPGLPPETLVATLTITGSVTPEKLCLRRYAIPGQEIFVTGRFGNSFASEHHLDFTPRLAESDFLAGRFTACMIDVSDGLLLDLGRVAAASGCGMELDRDAIPLLEGATPDAALGDGEDYELIFTVDADNADALIRQWPFASTPLTRIGRVTKSHPGLVFDANGVNLTVLHHNGFKHFDHDEVHKRRKS